MWWFDRRIKALGVDVAHNVEATIAASFERIGDVTSLHAEIISLQRRKTDLELAAARLDEQHARETREIEHKIGLERKRQEMELAATTREMRVQVREENLSADRQRFDAQMTFQNDRFSQEVGYLKGMIETLAARLPTVVVSKRTR